MHTHAHPHPLSIYIYVSISEYLCLNLCEVTEIQKGRYSHTYISVFTYLDLSMHWEFCPVYCNYIKLLFYHLYISKVHKLLFQREARNAHHWYLTIISIPNNISVQVATWTHTHTCTHAYAQTHRICDLGFQWSSIFVTL